MKNRCLFPLVCIAALCAAGLSAQAQQPDDTDYSAVLQEAMKSGRYSQNQTQDWDGRVKKVSGDVRVKEVGSEEWAVLEGEMPLNAGDTVKTADGVAEVYLDDKGAITVGRNSEFELTALAKSESVFSLAFGSIAAKIQRFLDEKLKLQVRTPSAVCAVRGTEFAVEYAKLGKGTGVAVFDEGKVAVVPLDENGQEQPEYALEKNTELVFTPGQKRFKSTPLARMARYRTPVIGLRRRVLALRKTWKPLSEARKMAIRERILKRSVIRREIGTPRRGVKKGRGAVRTKRALNGRLPRRARK